MKKDFKIDLSGKIFGKLTVIGFSRRDSKSTPLWNCCCSCGNTSEISGYYLVSHKFPSCGCAKGVWLNFCNMPPKPKHLKPPSKNINKTPKPQKKIRGRGYIGGGVFSKENSPLTFSRWLGLFSRCYSGELKEYIGVEVSPEWYNFQDFAEWFHGQTGHDKGWHIDKDLFGKILNKREYGPDTCCLLPAQINAALVEGWSNKKDTTPKGVTSYSYDNSKFYAEHKRLGEKLNKFLVNSEDEAVFILNKRKSETMIILAELYKHELPERIFHALCFLAEDYDRQADEIEARSGDYFFV